MTYPNPTGEVAGTLARDVELCKAAVLYADRVELISAVAPVLQSLESVGTGGLREMISLLAHLDDETLDLLGLDADHRDPQLLALLPLLGDAAEAPDFMSLLPPDGREAIGQLIAGVEQAQAQFEQLQVDSGAAELRAPLEAGLLTVKGLAEASSTTASLVSAAAGTAGWGDPTSDLALSWADALLGAFRDPLKRVVVEPEAASVVRALLELAGSPSDGTMERSRAAHLGTGFIARLPALPTAPFDELLDMRRDLTGPLVRYRAAVVRLSRTLSSRPFDRDFRGEADDLWTTDVAPAIDEIDALTREHGLVADVARHLRTDVRSLVERGAALFVGLEGCGPLSHAVNASIGVGANVAQSIGAAIEDSRTAATKAEGSEMYYLYRLGTINGPE